MTQYQIDWLITDYRKDFDYIGNYIVLIDTRDNTKWLFYHYDPNTEKLSLLSYEGRNSKKRKFRTIKTISMCVLLVFDIEYDDTGRY